MKRDGTGWTRAFRALPTLVYGSLAGLFGFGVVVEIVSLATYRYDELRQRPRQEVRGHLVETFEQRDTAPAIVLRLEEYPVTFRIDVPSAVPALGRAVRAGIARSSDVVLEVDAQELAAARTSTQPVFTFGVTIDGRRLATAEELFRHGDRYLRLSWIIGVIAALLCCVFAMAAYARRRLGDLPPAPVVEWSGDAASLREALGALKPPFALHPRFGRPQLIAMAICGAVLVPGGGAVLMLAATEWSTLHEESRIWKQGVRGLAEVETVYRTKGKHDSKLRMTLHVVEPATHDRRVTVEVPRTFDWPGGMVEVRFSPDDPDRLVTTAHHATETRRAGLVVLFLVIGAGMLALMLFVTSRMRGHLDKVRTLAREGKLILAELVAVELVGGEHPQRKLTYRMPPGHEVVEHTSARDPGPLLIDGKVVVLSALDQRSSHAVRTDGHPLAAVPWALPPDAGLHVSREKTMR